ncbi:hypothetical protein [Rufibacter aurantiacus]|uniref:hypothetical protein n=1 Tax=Rufibacter aurantiacus TaxID=2817374 RepID=UPI001B30469D|nr:hypothetical protein [Rufibacter aurantiacus]
MRKILLMIGMVALTGCATQKRSTTAENSIGDTRTQTVESHDEDTYLLRETSSDKSYGYDRSNPIKVGGSLESSGPRNERRFLNALLGLNGEQVGYYRAGSCCGFKTPNGFMGEGLLDKYRVYWEGGKDTLSIYINMYDKGDLKVPVGFTAKK